MLRQSHQLHVWLTESDAAFLRTEAERAETTVSAVVRNILREHRLRFHEALLARPGVGRPRESRPQARGPDSC